MGNNLSISSPKAAVSIRDVSLRFDNFDALKHINLELFQGETLALLGHNGAGKSSLIKIILGLIQPSAGQRILQSDQGNRSSVNLGYLPESVSFYDKLTGREVLSYFADLKGVVPSRVSQLIEEFELEYAQHRPLKTYSKGMKQRLGVAQAILSEPKILLLDEPTVGLDPQASQFLYQKIDQLKQQGCAVVVCTHELSIVEKHLDRALLLAKGQQIGEGTVDELRIASHLSTQITMPDFVQRIADDGYLRSLSNGRALMVNAEERQSVIEYLVKQKSWTDFMLFEPSLETIYHHFMEDHFLQPQAQAVPRLESVVRERLTRLQALFRSLSRQGQS